MNRKYCKNCIHCDMERKNDKFDVRCKLRHEWVGIHCTCGKHEHAPKPKGETHE